VAILTDQGPSRSATVYVGCVIAIKLRCTSIFGFYLPKGVVVVYMDPYDLSKKGELLEFLHSVYLFLGLEEDLAIEAGVLVVLPMGSW